MMVDKGTGRHLNEGRGAGGGQDKGKKQYWSTLQSPASVLCMG